MKLEPGGFLHKIVGVDIGKLHHEAIIIDEHDAIQGKSLCFANSHTGFNELLEPRHQIFFRFLAK